MLLSELIGKLNQKLTDRGDISVIAQTSDYEYMELLSVHIDNDSLWDETAPVIIELTKD